MSDVRAGDVLLSWERFDRKNPDRLVASGHFDSPYDLVEVLVEQGPRGPIVLRGKRAGKPKVWSFSSGALSYDRWEARTAPAIAGFDRTRARVAYSLLRAKDSEEGAGRLEVVGVSLEERDPRAAAWIFGERTFSLGLKARCVQVDSDFRRAFSLLSTPEDSIAASHTLRCWSDWAASCRAISGIGLNHEGLTDQEVRSRFLHRKKLDRKSNALQRNTLLRVLATDRATHRKLAEARTLLALAREYQSGTYNVPKGRRRYRNLNTFLTKKALEIIEVQAPASYDLARALNVVNLGPSVSGKQEEMPSHRGIDMLSTLSPTLLDKATALATLGNEYRQRGQIDIAEFYFRLSLSQNPQEDWQKRSVLGSLQAIAMSRDDHQLGKFYSAGAQRIPAGLSELGDLDHRNFSDFPLGKIEIVRKSYEFFLKPLVDEVASALPVSDPEDIWSMQILAMHRRAESLLQLEGMLLRSIEQRNSLDLRLARLYLELGETQIHLGKHGEGVRQILESLNELDRVDHAIGGGSDPKALREARVQYLYRQAVLGRLNAGGAFQALETIDRGRGRELARHQRASSVTLAPAVLELDSKIDLLTSQLESSDSEDDQQRLRAEIRDLRAAQRLLRPSEPKRSDPIIPLKLTFPEIRASLDPGTLFLYYVVGSHQTYIFAIRRGGETSLSIFHFPIESHVLASRVKAFLKGIKASREPREIEAIQLYRLLVLPVQSLIESSDRIAISAEGPLLSLPFSALRHDGRYLAEVKPIHRIASVATFKRLKDRRLRTRDSKSWNIVAFADPRYSDIGGSEDGVRDPALTQAIDRGLSLAPLPASRFEVESLAESFPSTRTFFGADASESNAREYSASADVLHFACHGLLDSASPYDSSLALATPKRTILGRDNGLLQAWEVGERLSLKAELVTLSACKTALGDAGSGEGLLGMSWAFQAAGARSVVASTWSVSDRETAELMKRFYRHLSEGLPKDEALRSAQADMIHSGDSALAAPAAWAGFELFGDWR